MKPYFGKQVIERPRRGSDFRSLKARHFGRSDADGEYDGPTRIPMSRHAVDRFYPKLKSKDFTDLLGPITRYLFGKVGARWDDVFSELSQALGSGSYPIRHVLYSHILSSERTLRHYAQNGCFFVDDAGFVRYKHWLADWKPKVGPVRKVQDGERWFVEVKGIWFIGRFERAVLDKFGCLASADWPNYREGWGNAAVTYRFVKIKQANRRELKLLEKLKSRAAK